MLKLSKLNYKDIYIRFNNLYNYINKNKIDSLLIIPGVDGIKKIQNF